MYISLERVSDAVDDIIHGKAQMETQVQVDDHGEKWPVCKNDGPPVYFMNMFRFSVFIFIMHRHANFGLFPNGLLQQFRMLKT